VLVLGDPIRRSGMVESIFRVSCRLCGMLRERVG